MTYKLDFTRKRLMDGINQTMRDQSYPPETALPELLKIVALKIFVDGTDQNMGQTTYMVANGLLQLRRQPFLQFYDD